ncbi:hypothetical protein MLGJGCBP_02032 [Rhodococcus sp. T7]|nr:hypothetical protein MLGJGCBP_02032 [Rhodococcus sp. T7]
MCDKTWRDRGGGRHRWSISPSDPGVDGPGRHRLVLSSISPAHPRSTHDVRDVLLGRRGSNYPARKDFETQPSRAGMTVAPGPGVIFLSEKGTGLVAATVAGTTAQVESTRRSHILRAAPVAVGIAFIGKKETLLPRLELTVHLLLGSGAGRQSDRHRRPVLEPTDSANCVVRGRKVADSGSGPDRTGAVDADRLAREATHDYARHGTYTLFGAWMSPPARSPGCAYRGIALRSSSSSSNSSLAPTRSESCIW